MLFCILKPQPLLLQAEQNKDRLQPVFILAFVVLAFKPDSPGI